MYFNIRCVLSCSLSGGAQSSRGRCDRVSALLTSLCPFSVIMVGKSRNCGLLTLLS